MERYIKGLLLGLVMASSSLLSCSKEFLEAKPQKSQVVVRTLDDIVALLDNAGVMNRTDFFKLLSDGDLFFTESQLMASQETNRNLYLWKADYDPTKFYSFGWDLPYQQILYANIALETLDEIKPDATKQSLYNETRGRALFFRAWAHYQLLQDFAEAYDPQRPEQLGVPIILESTFPKQVKRAPLKEGYQAIVADLETAESLLSNISTIKTRPSRQAVYSLLSQVCLNMADYPLSLSYSDKALEINKQLLDYNELSPTGIMPFDQYNDASHPEIVFFASSNTSFVAKEGIECVEDLYDDYMVNDLRKRAFFNTAKQFVGTYSGRADYQFTGLAVDELYLTKAECLVRMDRLEEARKLIQTLLEHRYVDNVVTVTIPQNKDDLLRWILLERRKELFGRGTRWTDLKRLNREPAQQKDLQRTYQGQDFELPANSNRYVFFIPDSEVEMSGLEQNNRD
ncbi:RagB/SusD family nutrient uptake outer membrane protein [Sphingobacterium yanglingense]|uniref:SusD-like starch-binding protein associating with outer membrane n=1 Tax=Sphingobacterium yanglingense TaxID=1437280 RepID=A0A4R6WG17_9SPHI|nr:RagB/SusD family nutrient uptake outer membrane protein [Sphingobacterium yanglingense]TDQ79090.1 SusD-like starch-binding protein associating with outer membrane [Sphingobacterium yanglingense]